MTIDRDSLSVKQKTIYDMWLMVPGRTLDDPELEKLLGVVAQPKSRIRKVQSEAKEAVRREAELVVKHLLRKRVPRITQCQNCDESFATDYEFNKHCSDECLRRTLEKLGLKWNPEKSPEERWQAEEIPSVISPVTLKTVMPLFRASEVVSPPVLQYGSVHAIPDDDDPFADVI